MSNYKYKRIEGYLKPLTGEKIPKRFIFFDTETTAPTKDNNINEFKLILGVAVFIELNDDLTINRREEYVFRDTMGFIDIIESYVRSKTTIYIMAHNIGFDVRVLDLPSVFNSLDYNSEPPILNQNAFIWRVKKDDRTFLFMDTSNLGVRSVYSLGKDLGFPKRDIDFNTCTTDELTEYCKTDVQILEKFVIEYIRYIDQNGLGSFKVTLASQAITAYRTRFMYNPPVIHNKKEVLELERKSYHGGRVECFALGNMPNKNYYYLDVNSMYPYAMSGNDLPTELVNYSHRCDVRMLPKIMEKFYVIADVEIETSEPVYPYLSEGKLTFPIGSFRTVLSHHELLYAVEHNHVRKVYMSAKYKMGSLFDEYVKFFYDEKVKHTEVFNSTYRMLAKLYLNSLYGKWGQQQPHREEIGKTKYPGVQRMPMYDQNTFKHYQEVKWYGTIFHEYKEGETSFSCPHIASAICAKARMLLWMYIKHAGIENVLYVDTDSLITNARGFRRLNVYLHETALGSLKLEAQSRGLTIRGNKDYIFGAVNRHKGVPSKAKQIEPNKWEYLEFEGFASWMNRGARGNPKGSYKIKTRKSEYNKGVVQQNGKVKPFVLFSVEPRRHPIVLYKAYEV